MTELKKVLMSRDGLSDQEAQELIDMMRNMVLNDGYFPDDILLDYAGLEPDYLEDLLYG